MNHHQCIFAHTNWYRLNEVKRHSRFTHSSLEQRNTAYVSVLWWAQAFFTCFLGVLSREACKERIVRSSPSIRLHVWIQFPRSTEMTLSDKVTTKKPRQIFIKKNTLGPLHIHLCGSVKRHKRGKPEAAFLVSLSYFIYEHFQLTFSWHFICSRLKTSTKTRYYYINCTKRKGPAVTYCV